MNKCVIIGILTQKSVESVGGEDQKNIFLMYDNFLTQHVQKPTRHNVGSVIIIRELLMVEMILIIPSAQFMLNLRGRG